MSHYLISRLQRRASSLLADRPAPYRTDLLAVVDQSGRLTAAFPAGTQLDTALASVAHADSGDTEDLLALLRLEARDGNAEAAAALRRHHA